MQFDELFTDSVEYPGPSAAGEPSALSLPKGGFGGVYLLTDAEDRVIQLAATADLKRALAVRLGETEGETPAGAGTRSRANLREIVRRIRWRPAHSMFEVTFDYHRIARTLMPDKYLTEIGFGPSWFVHVDPRATFPRFQAGKLLRCPPGVDLGPLATQADAGRFIEILEDAFDLCRYYHVLQQAPHGQACAYHDMGKCPAPCNGSISMADYRAMIERAWLFAAGNHQEALAGWETAMRTAAAERAYERAAAIKQLIERARRIEHESYRLVRPVESFRYLVVQRGRGMTWVKPFFVRGGCIEAGQPVRLKQLVEAVPEWIAAVRTNPPTGVDHGLCSEHIWLVSHFLFKRDPPGLYVPAESLGDAGPLAERIREHFVARDKPASQDLGGGGTAEGPPTGLV